ncbi:MAG: hypothetical protein JWP35_3356 [Caulobacter sp.]|nr:hypothetical protein [Caulobacter sp.]
MARTPPPLPDSFDPLEMALDAERGDPAPDSPARVLMKEQTRLVRLQIASERAGVALKAATGLAGLVVALALGSMVWSAAHDHGMVIAAFQAPPDFARRGLSGDALASKLQDNLALMQSQTGSGRAPSSIANNWGDNIKVDIPSTGVSIGEINRYLRDWLGHQTRVSGLVEMLDDGSLAVTARVGGHPGQRFTGPAGSLEDLIQKAAEKVYEDTQPYRYGIWLRGRGRVEEAKTVFRALIKTGPASERPWALAALSNTITWTEGPEAGRPAAVAALALDPFNPPANGNLAVLEMAEGHDEAALALFRRQPGSMQGAHAGDLQPSLVVIRVAVARAQAAQLVGDCLASQALFLPQLKSGAYISGASEYPIDAVRSFSACHEPTAAQNQWDAIDKGPPASGLNSSLQARDAIIAGRLGQIALERQDWPAVLAATRYGAPPADWSVPSARVQATTFQAPVNAIALARMGRFDEASAVIQATPRDCYPCLIARAEVASLKGDRAQADRWFALAVRQGPSLPFAEAVQARARLRGGDPAGAIAAARAAAVKGPRFADPLEYWGEALLRQGDAKGAEAKFRQANVFAPRWGANHLHWGEALMRLGRADEARAQWLTAQTLDLTSGERAWLDHLLKGGR